MPDEQKILAMQVEDDNYFVYALPAFPLVGGICPIIGKPDCYTAYYRTDTRPTRIKAIVYSGTLADCFEAFGVNTVLPYGKPRPLVRWA